MINTANGHIIVSPFIEIGPGDLFEGIEKLNLGEKRDVRNMGNGYLWLDVYNLLVDSRYFIISFCFYEFKLVNLSFIVSNTLFDVITPASWDNWSLEMEMKNLEFYKEWLNKEIGAAEKKFSWGDVGATYDEKGGSSSIYLGYKK